MSTGANLLHHPFSEITLDQRMTVEDHWVGVQNRQRHYSQYQQEQKNKQYGRPRTSSDVKDAERNPSQALWNFF